MHINDIVDAPGIQSLRARFLTKHTHPYDPDACWEWIGGKEEKGYGYFFAYGRNKAAHRVSHVLHIGPIPEGLWVLHECDNTSCVNPKHLFTGTARDNTDDMLAKKREAFGVKNWNAVLTEADIAAIKQDHRVQHIIAADYGITQSNVSLIKSGKRWKRTNE